MKNIVYTLYIFLFCMLQAVAQTTTQNHVKTTTYRQPTTTTDISKAKINVTYYDGLGRPTQQVAGKASATGKDIITHIEYDGIGRQSREYLPYGASTSTLAFDASAQTNTVTFYNNAAYENTDNPYSEKIFEASPLNRIRKQAAPGEAWKANEQWINGKFLDQDHTIKYAYQTNILDEVLRLTATATWNATNKVYDISFVSNGNYAAGQLYKSMTVSEERTSFYVGTALVSKSYLTEEFKDKEGRLVLKRKYLTTNSADTFFTFPLDTYYVYDQYGNLTYVLPPLAKGTISQLDDLCYQYKYDSKNRLVEKKLPGKNWEFIVYDGLDRIVATGPTASPFGDGATGWLYNMYDSFGRVCLTGWYPGSVTAATRKTLQDANTGVVNILRGTSTIDGINTGYTAASLVPSGFKLLSAKYYDNYTFPGGLTTLPTTIEAQAVLPDAKGLATGSWTRAITTSAQTFGETAYTLYDKKMRPIRSMTTNYLGGYTQTDIKLDFDGKTLYTITKHKRLGTGTETELTVRDDFAYTVQDRLLRQTHKINSLPTQLITYNTYDELGQLLVKKVGGVDVTGTTSLQKIDYTYNIRGWLKGINNITDLALPSAPQDLFAFKINYNDTPSNGVNGSVQPKYNGNIAETSWRTASDNIQRRYGYEYDNLERLNNAWYLIPGASVELRKSYDEYVKYDWNGNITSLQRNGESDNDVTTIAIDNLAYTYSGNRLTKVVDSTNHPKGFKDSSDNTGDDYTYYDNGNMKTDKNKGIITPIKYNHLNLPVEIVFNNNSATKIVYIYDAEGKKLKKTVTNGATVITDYLSGYQYQNGVLEFFPTSEGYVKSTVSGSVTTYNYVFNYKDHLGNVRVSYTIDPADNVLKIMDENHYYPFGLKHNGYSPTQKMFAGGIQFPPYVVLTPVLIDADATYKYKYNGKELQDEVIGVSTANPTGFSLNLYDYGARSYDPAIARWTTPDPLLNDLDFTFNPNDVDKEDEDDLIKAIQTSLANGEGIYNTDNLNPYGYGYNNPVSFDDPDGRCPICVVVAIFLYSEFANAPTGDAATDTRNYNESKANKTIVSETVIKRGSNLLPVSPSKSNKVKNTTEKTSRNEKTYQTYTKKNDKTKEVYSGKTSGKGTPKENIAKRDASHHKNKEGFGPAKLDKSSKNSDAIRGREQRNIKNNGGAKSEGGTSGNSINGVSPKNPNAQKYDDAAKKEFGD